MKTARDLSYRYNYRNSYANNKVSTTAKYQTKKTTKKQIPLFHRLVSLGILFLLGLFILPYSYNNIAKPLYNSFKSNKTGATFDSNDLYRKTTFIFHNDSVNGKRVFINPPKKAVMQTMYESAEMPHLKSQLIQLAAQYPTLQPSVFVWDYQTGKYVDINADKPYSAASIIKIPVLLELFKSIENKELSLKDKFILKDIFRASGSGELQFKEENSLYTIDELARRMMRDSDNSATNILMYLTGGSTNVNRAMREWGMKTSHITNWLPDLEGDNKTTAKEMATMLFNIENPNFLSLSSREYIIDYLSDIRNNRLIYAGLPSDALFIHKTGDIGKMLGDAGIVYTSGGERYIIVVLVNRPYNSAAGKDFIVKASSVIYASMTGGKN